MPTTATPPYTHSFFKALDSLLATHKLIIDRPRGSPHPTYPEFIYPLDYGYLEGTRSADGAGIDVWFGSQLPLDAVKPTATALVVTVDLAKADSEIKVLVGCTLEEIRVVLEWHNGDDLQNGVLIERPVSEDEAERAR